MKNVLLLMIGTKRLPFWSSLTANVLHLRKMPGLTNWNGNCHLEWYAWKKAYLVRWVRIHISQIHLSQCKLSTIQHKQGHMASHQHQSNSLLLISKPPLQLKCGNGLITYKKNYVVVVFPILPITLKYFTNSKLLIHFTYQFKKDAPRKAQYWCAII